MKWLLRGFLAVLGLLVAGVAWWLFAQHHAALPPARTTAAKLQDPQLIARGAYLAAIGDCAACHTAQGGQPYAGGRALPTPFGDVPAPNLTPDDATGLGQWSFDAFWRALHEGVGRDGHALYPAFPYTSYTRVSRQDAFALFAYLRSLPPVRSETGAPSLRFPYDLRASLATWRTLYFRPGEFVPDPKQSAEWNRGAYLVQGLGHCNECHVARDNLGGLPKGETLTGGQIPAQNWYAPDLSTRAHGGLEGWRADDIVALLKTGQSAKGAAFGPMADVVTQSTQHMRDDDLRAIATYLQSLPPRPARAGGGSEVDATALISRGGKLYAQQCASCHGQDGQGVAGVYPPLAGNASVTEPTGINAIRVVLLGGFAPSTAAHLRPYSMPPFAQQLSDADVAAVVSYIRHAWSNDASPVMERDVANYRHTPVE
ncbi:c-type cytochrome [Frateuria terrea]|uniref:Cytochrome c n=1 Tax=Frateuria terrea TaxID=529704 RepID=A0A1H6ZM50_9GAMM|nr:c-type cytochrome [Frateuria terrea]SEJ53234.1 Cytochrome c [Frateuria terrea]SFP80703.1 Cytochrome c [Frateuria terrea]